MDVALLAELCKILCVFAVCCFHLSLLHLSNSPLIHLLSSVRR